MIRGNRRVPGSCHVGSGLITGLGFRAWDRGPSVGNESWDPEPCECTASSGCRD